MRNKRTSYIVRILSVLLIPMLAIGLFSGCEPDLPYDGVDFVERYDYAWFPLYVEYQRGEVLGQALNQDVNRHERYYALEGVDPDVMIYLERKGNVFFGGTGGLFYNPEKIDLLMDAFQPSGMVLRICVEKPYEVDGGIQYDRYFHYVWLVTQDTWDAWKEAFQTALVKDYKMKGEYLQKQLSLYEEMEKRILVVEQSDIKDYCREYFLQKKEATHAVHSDHQWVEKDGTRVSASLDLRHYVTKGYKGYYTLFRATDATLCQNRKKEWVWCFSTPDRNYEISISDSAEEGLFALVREASEYTKDENTPTSSELADFWSQHFPENKLPPVFTFPGLGDLVPESE